MSKTDDILLEMIDNIDKRLKLSFENQELLRERIVELERMVNIHERRFN